MELAWIDIASFVAFFVVTVGTALYKSRDEKSGEDFFFASRGLIWPLIGLSLIAVNISTEQFVGQAGRSPRRQADDPSRPKLGQRIPRPRAGLSGSKQTT